MHDKLDRLISLYDQGRLTRRQLLQGLLGLGVGTRLASDATGSLSAAGQRGPLFRTHTINHVTIHSADVARSKAFYQSLTGLSIRDEGKDFCEFRVEGGFLGVYALEAGQRAGFDHFCFGIENYDAQRTLATLKVAVPEARPTLEPGDQVYVRDPDGVRVQFADVTYKP